MTRILVGGAICVALGICAVAAFGAEGPKTLTVPFNSEAAAIDGAADAVWSEIPATTDFCYPWRTDEPEKTSLKIYHDKTNLYLFWDVTDSTPVFVDQKEEMDIAGEDRVEVYFDAESPMKNYYSVETSPTGLALDYQCEFYRKFDFSWSFPGLRLAGVKRPDGYAVEAAFPLDSLRRLGALKEDGTIRAGFYRANFERSADGKILEKWISWVNPNLPEEDFHVPQTLGLLRLE